jgi:hypothetical protein
LYHHPANKQSVLASLIHRAKALYDQDSRTMDTALDTATKSNDKPTSPAYISYTQTTYGRLSRMLDKHNIKMSPYSQ